MSDMHEAFPHPDLPSEDSIRVLNLEPGDFHDPLICQLQSIPFREKPEYVALSYTWSDPYRGAQRFAASPKRTEASPCSSKDPSTEPQDLNLGSSSSSKSLIDSNGSRTLLSGRAKQEMGVSRLFTVRINNHQCYIGHNLLQAMLHLRSRTHPLHLWVDAICINQADEEERNSQVTLMSYVYTRAARVVVWLGTRENRGSLDTSEYTAIEWQAGQTQRLAASLISSETLRSSSEPDLRTFGRIANSAYWNRVWIIQETCLPRRLSFTYGSCMWDYNDLREWKCLESIRSELDGNPQATKVQRVRGLYGAMLRVLDARETRFTNSMGLEALVERFRKNNCTEIRDRIYGFLGLANDVQPHSTKHDVDRGNFNPQKKTDSNAELNLVRAGGRSLLQVNYKRSCRDIWVDMVLFIASSTKKPAIRHERLSEDIGTRQDDVIKMQPMESLPYRIVRAAGMVQEALGQIPENEVLRGIAFESYNEPSKFEVYGYRSCQVLHLGPRYEDLIASSHAQQDWVNSWSECYHTSQDLEKLRKTMENYFARILSYDDKDLARLQTFAEPDCVAWSLTEQQKPESVTQQYREGLQQSDERPSMDLNDSELIPRISLATNNAICLVPHGTQVGDSILQFWGCSAATVIRPDLIPTREISRPQLSIEAEGGPSFLCWRLIGRADVAESLDELYPSEIGPHVGKACPNNLLPESPEEVPRQSNEMRVQLNLSLLQKLTSAISVFKKAL